MKQNRTSLLLVAFTILGACSLSLAQETTQPKPHKHTKAQVTRFEKHANALQPPAKVLDAIGVKPGMIMGEVGAGSGRYTVHLAARVGSNGKVYANDINPEALDFLRERCIQDHIANIETVLGTMTDPRFPKGDLDMVFMVWTYHMLGKPVELLTSLKSYLKPGATIVMVEPIPSETEHEIAEATEHSGKKPDDINVVTRESVERDANKAGLRLIKAMEGFLEEDNIFILKAQ